MPIGDYAVGNAEVSGLDATFANQLDQFIAASPGVSIYSAYRSPQKQAGLWDAALKKYGSADVARRWVAPPGHSYHGRGQAADLRFSTPEALSWAHDNAAKYGLKFPLSNENWHIEPMGTRGGHEVGSPAPIDTGGATMPNPPVASAGADNPPSILGMLPTAGGPSSSPGVEAGGPRFTADNMTTDAFLSDYFNGINPMRTLVLGKLRSIFA
jgi:hypothetical protein